MNWSTASCCSGKVSSRTVQLGNSYSGFVFPHDRLDIEREDRAGFVPKAMCCFFELAAVVLFEVSWRTGAISFGSGR